MFCHRIPHHVEQKKMHKIMQHSIFGLNINKCNDSGASRGKISILCSGYKQIQNCLLYRYWKFPCTNSDVHARVTAFVIVKIYLAIFRTWNMGKQFSKLFPRIPCLFPVLNEEIKMLIYMYIEKH